MLELWLRVLVSLGVTAYLAWEDARTSFMNEKLLVAFVALGVLLDVVFLPSSQWLLVFGLAALWAVVGWFSYKSGQFGGGDVLLLLGLHLWLPFSPFVPVPWPFILSVFVASAALASLGSTALYAWKLSRFPLDGRKKTALAGLALFSLAIFIFPFSLGLKALFYLLLLSASFYLLFRKELMDQVVIQPVSLKNIEDEDVLATERISEKDLGKFKLERVLTPSALKKLLVYAKAKKLKTVPIFKDLPRFGPYLLAGLIVCLALGDLVWFLMVN